MGMSNNRKSFFIFFTFVVLLPMFVGLPILLTILYFLSFLFAATFIIPLFICRHCPHWNNKKFYLECDAHYGIPKVYSYIPKPLNLLQQYCVYIGFIFIFGIPVLLLILHGEYQLSICSAANGILWYVILKKNMCSTCTNHNCPLSKMG